MLPAGVEEFALFYKRPPDQLGPEQIRQSQAHLFSYRRLDANTVAQHLSALRFFFIKTLKRNWSVEETPYPKRPIRLPDVLSREEAQRSIDSADSPLHCVWPVMLYATGLRRAGLVQLKVSDHYCPGDESLLPANRLIGRELDRVFAFPDLNSLWADVAQNRPSASVAHHRQ